MTRIVAKDILIVGGGVLGVGIAYWLSSLYDCRIAVVDLERGPAMGATSRNTGVIHRPFYLDPAKKKVFVRTSMASLPLWRSLAESRGLPWSPVGTYNVGIEEEELRTLERYRGWGLANGMEEGELALLDGREVSASEPEVRCRGALLSRTDVSVDFGTFTRHLWSLVAARGVAFLGGRRVVGVRPTAGGSAVALEGAGGREEVECRYMINAAGGGALALAQRAGFAREYASLNFRGEYWVVDEPFASRVGSNIYRPPRFPKYPFLDPHFVVRADGTRQIGPNAVAVPGPYVYRGLGLSRLPSFLSRPALPKARLAGDRDFLSMVAAEWMSSLSKRAMCGRVQNFVPGVKPEMLRRRAVFGVRSPLVSRTGFVPEALLFTGPRSAHVVNYNSPGATGGPAYSALVVKRLRDGGFLDGLARRESPPPVPGWEFDSVTAAL